MKNLSWLLVVSALMFSDLSAGNFTKKASGKPTLTQSGKQKNWCPICGMSLKMFYKTSHASLTKDGKHTQYCSIRCLVSDNLERGLELDKSKVVDVKSGKLVPVNEAFYVVGSKVPGTMSKVSKLGFKSKKDAEQFKAKMGGELKNFKQVYEMAKKSLKKDISMTDKKRKKIMYPMGKKLLALKCDKSKLDPFAYHRINELKPVVKANCRNLKEKQAQAVALYLWDVVRFKKTQKGVRVSVTKDEKCPVCGMFVYKYPRWAAKIVYDGKHYVFDGVKDLAKYIKESKKYGGKGNLKAKKVIVADYYTQFAIDGRKAFYVVGSDVLGPMGHELIPFEKMSDAEVFKKDHKGTDIIEFDQISTSLLCKLDGKVCE